MIKGLHVTCKKKPGKPIRWYVYAWRGGPQIATRVGGPRPKLTREELAAVSEACMSDRRVDPRTLASLIREWRSEDPARPSSPEWQALADGTKKTWGSQLNAIEAKWGKTTIAVWNDPRMVQKIVQWRDSRAATPRAADNGVIVLRELLKFARLRGRIAINVADGIPRLYKGGDRAEIIWTDEEIDRFMAAATKLERPHIADGIRLAALTGLRRADLVSLTWAQVGEFAIVKKALKVSKGRRRRTTMPRVPELDALLEELRQRPRRAGVQTVLVNSFGESWSGDGYGGSFNRVRDEAKIVHIDDETGKVRKKHLHDVRGTFVTKLCTGTDLSNKEIGDIMAWSPERVDNIRRVYVDDARIVVAIGERIAAGSVNRSVNRRGEGDKN